MIYGLKFYCFLIFVYVLDNVKYCVMKDVIKGEWCFKIVF